MSEWSEWVEILWDFTKFYFKQMLKISAVYLEKQKSFIPKKNVCPAIVSKYAKIDSKDCTSCPNFQWRFWLEYLLFCVWWNYNRIQQKKPRSQVYSWICRFTNIFANFQGWLSRILISRCNTGLIFMPHS